MSFKHVDLAAAMTRLAERRIEEAMEQGKFDNLAGKGQPVDLDPLPPDENARFMYWAMRIFKHNDVIPDEIRYRKRIDTLKSELAKASSEGRVKQLVSAINQTIYKLNTMGTNIKETDIVPVSLEEELAYFGKRQR